MKHGITDQEWDDYLDGRATSEVSHRIEIHLAGCPDCWEFYEQLTCATRTLWEASDEARHKLTLDQRDRDRLLQGVLAQLNAGGAGGAAQVRGRLNSLETVLTPICGAQAAARAMQAAARHSAATSLDRVTHDNWEPFLDRLTAIAAAMCGETFANLVRERGQL